MDYVQIDTITSFTPDIYLQVDVFMHEVVIQYSHEFDSLLWGFGCLGGKA